MHGDFQNLDGIEDLAGSENSVFRPLPSAKILSFPKPVSPPLEGFGDVDGSSSWPSTFIPLGEAARAVVMRLQSDLPRLSVFAPREEE